MKIKEGSYGRSFTVGEEVYVVDADKFTVLTLMHVNGQWQSVSELSLTFENDNDILVKASGIYIWSEWSSKNSGTGIYHYSLSGDLLQQLDGPQSEVGSTFEGFRLLGVDALGNMLTSYCDGNDDKVQVFTNEKQWFDVSFIRFGEDLIRQVWCQGDDVFVVLIFRDDCGLVRFTKE